MKVYHILTHTMEFGHAELHGNVSEFANLDSTVNKFIKNLIRKDKKKEFEHTLVNLSKEAKEEQTHLEHRDGYPLIVVKNSFNLLSDPFEFSYPLIKFIRSADGILHTHGISSFVYDSIAPFLANRPSIAHYRGGHFTLRSFPISFPKYCLIAPLTLRMPRRLFIQNKSRLEKYNKYYGIPLEKMVYLPNAVELEKFQLDEENIQNWERKLKLKDELRILFVGRLERGKGILDLLEVFENVQKTQKVKLIIAGTGTLEEEIKSRGNPDVLMLGRVNEIRDMATLYYLSDVFVLPSYYEGFPNCVLEAMACEKPVLTTSTEGALDLVEDGETGLLVKPGDKRALEEKLKILLEDESLRLKLAKNARKKVEAEFTWDKISSKVFEQYRQIWKE